jgi:surface polysaccharide O-acyltransferase-like enzyme
VRQSNIELLRIIAMLMIIAHHFAYNNVYVTAYLFDTFNGFWLQMMRIGGKIGVSIFVIISGYFLVNSSGFKISKLLKLWLQVLTFSVVSYVISSLVQGSFDLSFKTIISTLMPLTYDRWWFASAYIVLFLLSPFLNKMLHALSRNAYLAMLLVMLFLWYVKIPD